MSYFVEDLPNNLSNKKIFLRLDLNFPLDNKGVVSDTTRLQKALPSLKYLFQKNAKVAIFSHLGRPKSAADKHLSLEPISKILAEELKRKVIFVKDLEKLKNAINNLSPSEIILMENLRFFAAEKKNDSLFCKNLADSFDYFVNDSFGTAHRKEASNYGLPQHFSTPVYGHLIQKEMEQLSKLLRNAPRPFVSIFGGAKLEDKIAILKNLAPKMDAILVGGGMAYTFLKVQGKEIGNSLLDKKHLKSAEILLKKYAAKIFLPQDHLVVDKLETGSCYSYVAEIPKAKIAVDIGEKTLKIYQQQITKAKCIFWNGPLGVLEIAPFEKGTHQITRAIADSSAFSVVAGGDSILAIKQLDLAKKISHISTGGGAAMKFLEGEELPAISILKKR